MPYLPPEKESSLHTSTDRKRIYYNLKHVSQMRVAINNVLEATLESAFQLILQLYILGDQYKKLRIVRNFIVIQPRIKINAMLCLSCVHSKLKTCC